MKATQAVSLVFALAVLLATPHRAAAQTDDVGGQFVGTWRLVSQTQRMADGTTSQDPKSAAYIIYTDTGHMCYVAMDPNRPRWASQTAPTPAEAVSTLTGFASYCGRVEIHAAEGLSLIHI